MRKFVVFVFCLFVTLSVSSQEKKNFFQRLFEKKQVVVHDTTYVYLVYYQIDTVSQNAENGPEIPMPFDTLPTNDRFQKVVLFNDNTWTYYDIEKPVLPDSLDSDHWYTDQVHAYRDIQLKDLPDEIDIPLIDSLHPYCIPAEGKIVSGFKLRRGRPHRGVDIDVDYGDPIYAAFDGVVRCALPPRLTGGYGNVLVIRHVNGLETYYGHLSKYIVESEDLVKAGDLIGYGGSTGRSTGAHLHFETRYMGQPFDPERIFDFEKGSIRSAIFTLKKNYLNIHSRNGKSDYQSKASVKRIVHTVRSGDTLGAIARHYHTTIDRICKLNGISRNKTLQLGQKLIVK